MWQVPAVTCELPAVQTAARYFLEINTDYVDNEAYIVDRTYVQASTVQTSSGVGDIGWTLVVSQSTSCPAGTFVDLTKFQCTTCITPLTSRAGATSCDLCIEGYYRHQGTCLKCPSHVKCDGQSFALDAGYFRTNQNSFVVYECPLGRPACPGGNTTGNCADGYHGVLCATCSSGYFMDRSSGLTHVCQLCGEPRSWFRSIMYLVIIVVVIVGLSAAAAKTGASKAATLFYAIGKVRIKWMLDVSQTISQFSSISQSTGGRHTVSEPAASFIQLLSLSNVEVFQFLPLKCSMPTSTFYSKLLITTTLLPLGPIAMVWIFFMFRAGARRRPLEAAKKAAKCSLYWIDIVLPTISTAIAQV